MAINYFPGRMTVSDEQTLKTMFEDIKDKLPWLINLTPEERRSANSIALRGLGFVDAVNEVVKDRPELFPAYFDLVEFQEIKETFDALRHLNEVSKSIQEAIDDSRISVASVLMKKCIKVYHFVREASNDDVAGTNTIYDTLRERFVKTGVANVIVEPDTNSDANVDVDPIPQSDDDVTA